LSSSLTALWTQSTDFSSSLLLLLGLYFPLRLLHGDLSGAPAARTSTRPSRSLPTALFRAVLGPAPASRPESSEPPGVGRWRLVACRVAGPPGIAGGGGAGQWAPGSVAGSHASALEPAVGAAQAVAQEVGRPGALAPR
jgi:hypothetical protein